MNRLFSRVFIVCSLLVILALAINILNNLGAIRPIYAILISPLVLVFCYIYCFKKKSILVIDIYKPIFFFNIIIIIIFTYSKYEFNLPLNDFKIGFTYSNFWDYFYQLMLFSDGTFKTINTGYLPLSFAISKFFALVSNADGANFVVTSRMVASYLLYLLIFLSPIVLIIRHVGRTLKLNSEGLLLVTIFLFTSYPLMFCIERGNFVIASFFFLTLFSFAYYRNKIDLSIIFMAFLINLKLLNFIFLIFFIRRFKGSYLKLFFYSLVINLGSLIYLFKVDLSKWALFKLAFISPFQGLFPGLFVEKFVATDGGRLQGMSFVDNFRVLLNTLFNNISINATTQIPLIETILIVFGLLMVIVFYLKCRNLISWIDELIFLVAIPIVFHSGSADYNLILLVPLLSLLLKEVMDHDSASILRYSGLFMMLSGGVVIYLVTAHEGIFNSASLKSLLVPFGLIGILMTIMGSGWKTRLKEGSI